MLPKRSDQWRVYDELREIIISIYQWKMDVFIIREVGLLRGSCNCFECRLTLNAQPRWKRWSRARYNNLLNCGGAMPKTARCISAWPLISLRLTNGGKPNSHKASNLLTPMPSQNSSWIRSTAPTKKSGAWYIVRVTKSIPDKTCDLNCKTKAAVEWKWRVLNKARNCVEAFAAI